jgi:hypothetical protein
MSSHKHLMTARESNKLNLTIRSADTKDSAGNDKKKIPMRSGKRRAAAAIELTLDDFGGRSDALGG